MLRTTVDESNLIIYLEPDNALSEADFQSVARIVDPIIEQVSQLNGIIIYTEFFPGWVSFAALVSHIEFVKNHHQKVKRIALVTDSIVGDLGSAIADHFVAAEVQHFAFSDIDTAKTWILSAD
jgi:hypothetical protein